MIISHSRKFLFLHLHKCAGTSVEATLEPVLGEEDILLGSTVAGRAQQADFVKATGLSKHSPAQQAFNHLGPDLWNDMLKVTVVRDPYSRMVSLYRFLYRELENACWRDEIPLDKVRKKAAKGELPNAPPYNFPGTTALIEAGFPESSYRTFLETDVLWQGPGTIPMYDRLAITRDGKSAIDMDIIMKFETLDEDWANLIDRLKLDVPLLRRNASGSYDPDIYYNDGICRDIISDRFATDLAQFGYTVRG